MNNVINKLFGNYVEEKKKFLLFAFLLIALLFLSFFLLRAAYARYQVDAKINADIDRALYIIGEEKMSFNIETDGIVPSSTPYTYRFSVSNFNQNNMSDVDINYSINIRTTTNLPITLELYRNQLPENGTNIFNSPITKRDADGAWYRVYKTNATYDFYYAARKTDVYTLVINFPLIYANDTTYSNYLESIEVNIESKQIV